MLKYYGYEISKPNIRNNHIRRRKMLLKNFRINKLLDVGANSGQYSKIIRNAGFTGGIISFEPLSDIFKVLERNILGDNNWIAYNYALGNFDGTGLINVAENNGESSSLLEMLPNHIMHRPDSKIIRQEKITIKKLDSLFKNIYCQNDNIFLKIDAQGYEYNILEGARESLNLIQGIQIEMSLEPLYAGEKLICEMIYYLFERGFKLMSIEPGSVNNSTGQMFQVDGVYFRT